MTKHVKTFRKIIKSADRIVITTHVYPDADGIGAQVALCLGLRSLKKECFCVNEEKLTKRYQHLDQQKTVRSAQDFLRSEKDFEIDLLIVVDTHSFNRIGPKMQELGRMAKRILFIDHHPAPKEVAAVNCIDTNKAATGEMVGEIMIGMGIPLTKEMALCLYTALIIDTSSFRYPTVTNETHSLAAELLKTGLSPSDAYNAIYGTKSINHLRILGDVLSEAKISENGKMAWLIVKKSHLEKYQIKKEDTFSFVNHLLVLDQIKVACLFIESAPKKLKLSLRSRGDIDVGAMAQALGGGGHNHSAAAILTGEFKETIKRVTKQLEEMLST